MCLCDPGRCEHGDEPDNQPQSIAVPFWLAIHARAFVTLPAVSIAMSQTVNLSPTGLIAWRSVQRLPSLSCAPWVSSCDLAGSEYGNEPDNQPQPCRPHCL